MSTAQIIYEQYKVLPKRVRLDLKVLIVSEDEPVSLLNELEIGLRQVKEMQTGKRPKRTFADLQQEMGDDQ